MLKSLLADKEPAAAALRGRLALMHRIERRFRFLAVRIATCLGWRASQAKALIWLRVQASTQSVIRGHRPSYRDALLAVRDRLQVNCPRGLSLEVRLPVSLCDSLCV